MKMLNNGFLAAISFGLMVLYGVPPEANAAITLNDLINGPGSIVVGDSLVFDQFSFTTSGTMPSGDGAQIDAIVDGSNFGIRLFGGFADYAGGGASVFELSYRVTPVSALNQLSNASLTGNPAVIGVGSFTITETLDGLAGPLEISNSIPGGVSLADSTNIVPPLSSVNVSLSLNGNAEQGAVTTSFVDQTFTLTGDQVVPEPASLVIWLGTLMLFGIVPVTYRRWSRNELTPSPRTSR